MTGSTSYGSAGTPNVMPQEVLDEAEGVVRVEERLADGLLVRVGRDRRQLGEQPDRGDLDLLGVERVEAVLVEGRQRADRAGQHRHRVRVAGEAVEEPLEVLVQQRVPADPARRTRRAASAGRQLAVDQQVATSRKVLVLGELLDRVAAVAQDAGVAVDVGDRRRARRGVDEAGVERDVPGRASAARRRRCPIPPSVAGTHGQVERAAGVLEAHRLQRRTCTLLESAHGGRWAVPARTARNGRHRLERRRYPSGVTRRHSWHG